ncbi:MAG: hypothetical protein QW228_01205 [Candidatus Aenigmatarchaeota archaeon]
MANYTPKAGLAKPIPLSAEDKNRWGELLNQNFDILDRFCGEIIEGRGINAASLNQRFMAIENALEEAASPYPSLDMRLDALETALIGDPNDEKILQDLQGKLASIVASKLPKNVIFSSSQIWYSYSQNQFTLCPTAETTYIIYINGKGYVKKWSSTLVLSNPGINKVICFDYVNEQLIALDHQNVAADVRSISEYDPMAHLPLGRINNVNEFIPFTFKGYHKYVSISAISLPNSGSILIPHNLGSIPKCYGYLVLYDSGNNIICHVQLPFAYTFVSDSTINFYYCRLTAVTSMDLRVQYNLAANKDIYGIDVNPSTAKIIVISEINSAEPAP